MEIAILFLPLLASIISGFFGKYIGDRNSEIITSLFVSISAYYHYLFFISYLNQYESNIVIATWINSGSLNVNWSIKIDALIFSNVGCCDISFCFSSYLFNWIYVS